MPNELNLAFPDKDHVVVTLNQGNASRPFSFINPLTPKDHKDIRWYLEIYGAHSLGDPDDKDAERIVGQLPRWGRDLYKAVFYDDAARERFSAFRKMVQGTRLLTISADHPGILALPWELLHNPADHSGFLFMENPRISIRRRVLGMDDGREAFEVEPKNHLHLLFVVSRPEKTGFIDPRADPAAVLDALDKHAPDRVSWEFLRPPTLDALTERLENGDLPPVDVVHFDGHGVYDERGDLPKRAAELSATRRGNGENELSRKEDKLASPVSAEFPPHTGYLLFEDQDGELDHVSANKLGANLHQHKVGLVILSACQSAAVGGDTDKADERPMGSVAARLTATGIPAVLAMTHSVLVPTTRALFGEFYKELARHKTVGEALDNARRFLFNHPEKYEVQRGTDREWLRLSDWFLPALYQPGVDVALLKRADAGAEKPAAVAPRTNLPVPPEAGFFGRRRSLWEIERWFAADTRRITLTGFGGQGKTALAQEAGRWLVRTGQFQAAVFVDYSQIRPADAAAVARNEIGRVLDRTFSEDRETLAALRATPTLIILDNLEALAPDALRALLDAAVPWSLAGGSRVLLTTRQPDFGHTEYKVEGTRVHRRIRLEGLGSRLAPDDALEWFASLQKLPPAPAVPPPAREALVNLFEEVRFHPLSIRILATQLKTRRPAEIGVRLGQLLADPKLNALAGKHEDTPSGLLASLTLSLDRLDAASRAVLPRLGVFQGGAFEDDLLAITGLNQGDERAKLKAFLAAVESGDVRAILRAMGTPADGELSPELVTKITNDIPRAKAHFRQKLDTLPPGTENLWPELRRQLEAAALIEAETVLDVGVPFLRFHPTLAPLLWTQLGAEEQTRFSGVHRQRYAMLAGYLYRHDNQFPHQARAVARRELPNLLSAVHAALDAAEPKAVDFADSVDRFLKGFGFRQEAEDLFRKAHAAAGELGSAAWYLAQSNHGEQLLAAGRSGEALPIFQRVLNQLGQATTYERAATLARLGRCFMAAARPDVAGQHLRDAITVLEALEPIDPVKRLRGVCFTDLADNLLEAGHHIEARAAYEAGLKIKEEIQNLVGQGVSLVQLGTLEMREGNLTEAAERYCRALALYQQLDEPSMEAKVWHQLGRVFEEAGQWEKAERHYRESVSIKVQQGNFAGAAMTWNQLALLSVTVGKPEAAERWIHDAIKAFQTVNDRQNLSKSLNNLAELLRTQPGRLIEARAAAEKALEDKKTLDPGAAEVWATYNILAGIAESEAAETNNAVRKAALLAEARDHRRLARTARYAFPGTRTQLHRFVPLVPIAASACTGSADAIAALAQQQAAMRQATPEWAAFADVLDRLLAGERDADALCGGLDSDPAVLTEYILAGIADPETLNDFLPQDAPPAGPSE